MAKSITLGLALSYVNRVDGRVHLHLHLPNPYGLESGGTQVRIRNGAQSEFAPATITRTDHGVFLDATVPAADLRRGTWRIQLNPNGGDLFRPTDGRVLIADPNPISLLIGAAPTSFVPDPRHTLPKRQRVAKSGGRVVDSLLAELRPDRATHVRQVLRRVARKVLPG